MDNLIYIKNETLPKDFCQFVINKFEASQHKMDGVSGAGVNTNVKHSKDLMIHALIDDKDWQYIYDYLRENLLQLLVDYIRLNPFIVRTLDLSFSSDLSLIRTCQGRFAATSKGLAHMQMQRYIDKEGYHAWHYENEVTDENMNMRQMAFMWYLNDVNGGGETEFKFQKAKVEAKTGRGVIFPAFWTHTHRGNRPNFGQSKYIITGWIEKIEPENVSLEFSQDYFI